MRKINAKAKKVVNKLITLLNDDGYLKLDNSDGTYTPLTVEKIGNDMYSFCHYGEQNGDLMRDPEMCLIKLNDDFYPYYFRNDYVGVEQESIIFDYKENGSVVPSKLNMKGQKDHAVFFGTWMENIKYQQEV